jgi:hypothetical protein
MVASISRHQLDGTTFIWLALGSIRSNNNNNMCSATHRGTAAQVRRAAGSKDPNIFPKVLEGATGWTVQERNEMHGGGGKGKNALHRTWHHGRDDV